ncbi:hypothetical protein D6D12_02288 [Aureobasidium pullulans]|uniref:Uncharacterized protein n=1 Tax=Aureobasidium pullulans TaxID=5580 RepID=A0AB74K1L3_AURPU|nr:hypothetical protein D6D12_02288 [Aureobasidium pullulans]THX65517.1 hypothetical protein D6D11_00380 [Aureobasidium pullulans]
MATNQQPTSRIPLRVDSIPTNQSSTRSLNNGRPATPNLSKPQHLRLSHKVLSTIYESSLDEKKQKEREATWSIRPVDQNEEEEQQSLRSQASSPNSELDTSLASTKPTTVSASQNSTSLEDPCPIDSYMEAYAKYRLLNLKTQKRNAATNLHIALDKTQFLTNQLHNSMVPFHLLITVLNKLIGSSPILKDLRERTSDQQITVSKQTEDFRLSLRDLLKSNHSLIAECENLLKTSADSNLELFTQERLAVNRLLATFSSNQNIKAQRDDQLELQQDVIAKFNEYVGGLIEGLEVQNIGLEKLVGDVNRGVRCLEEEIHAYVRDKKSLRGMVCRVFDRR